MKIVKNEKLIKRNGRIGQWSSLLGLAVLAGGMYISFQQPKLIAYSLVALPVGFILTQVSMYYGNRFGRSPRPDEKLDAGLKGLTGDFVIYHYMTPVPHLLVGPAGVWILMPYHQRGQVVYRNNRWRLSGGGFLQGYLRIFGQESVGRPELEAEHQINVLKKYLSRNLDEAELPEIKVMPVFTSEDLELDVQGAPLPAMKLKQIKDFMRQKSKENRANTERGNKIKAILESE